MKLTKTPQIITLKCDIEPLFTTGYQFQGQIISGTTNMTGGTNAPVDLGC